MRKITPTTVLISLYLLLSLLISQGSTQEAAVTMTGDGTFRRIRLPILMYHYISELPAGADATRIDLTVLPHHFRAQIAYLSANSYHTVSLYEIDDALLHGTPLPPRPVILTFDDGYIDHYQTVLPILEEFDFTGTFFIITDFADQQIPGYMTWDQIRQLAAAGMSIEPHTKSHQDLRSRSYDFLVYEIMGSLESIHAHLGIEPTGFAYPIGRYDLNTLQFLDTTPILRAVTTINGISHTTHNRFEVERLRVSYNTGEQGFAQLLRYFNP